MASSSGSLHSPKRPVEYSAPTSSSMPTKGIRICPSETPNTSAARTRSLARADSRDGSDPIQRRPRVSRNSAAARKAAIPGSAWVKPDMPPFLVQLSCTSVTMFFTTEAASVIASVQLAGFSGEGVLRTSALACWARISWSIWVMILSARPKASTARSPGACNSFSWSFSSLRRAATSSASTWPSAGTGPSAVIWSFSVVIRVEFTPSCDLNWSRHFTTSPRMACRRASFA